MKRMLLVAALVPAVCGIAWGQATDANDLCRDVIDPYNPVVLRAKFFTAAGADNELSQAEFNADQKKPSSFVQKFDRWSSLISFDKNKNSTADWFEADAYRRAFRKQVLAVFDKNKDTQLAGEERKAAIRTLAGGRFILRARPATAPPAVAPPPPPPTEPGEGGTHLPAAPKEGGGDKPPAEERPRTDDERRAEFERRRFDANRDGKLDEKEAAALAESRAGREKRRQDYLKKYDLDGNGDVSRAERDKVRHIEQFDENKDGKLDEKEGAKLAAHEAERAKQRQDYLKKYDLDGNGDVSRAERDKVRHIDRFDANKDGKLDEKEGAALAAHEEEHKTREADFLKKNDKDGDGQLSREERSAGYRAMAAERRKQFMAQYDTNQDGNLDDKERGAVRAAMIKRFELSRFDTNKNGEIDGEEIAARDAGRAEREKRRAEFTKRYDLDGDGKLNEAERGKMMEAMRSRFGRGRGGRGRGGSGGGGRRRGGGGGPPGGGGGERRDRRTRGGDRPPTE